ncbi:MAG TPA: response regulator [Chitinophagaceae bacterium]|nr:response regulator [Chitinophagaceae bacterium]
MILIVDDKPENLFSLKALLQLHLFEVDTANSGEEALKKILKNDYSLIILDVQMPGMDGYEVAEAVTGYSRSKNVPIIFLSAVNIDKRFVHRGYASGGIDYITKPFDPDLLMLKVKTFVRLYEQTQELVTIKATLEQKVEERTKELLQMNAELEVSNSELQQYAYVASHDLQEPLRKILTFSRLVSEKYIATIPDAVPYMNRIINASERMRNLIVDLLHYSQLAVTPSFKNINLSTIIKESLSDLELTIKEKEAEVIIESMPEMDVIISQMRQVFYNLINNAIKFSKEGINPVIKIESEVVEDLAINSSTSVDGDFCRITVSDNGIGFEEKYLDKIFTLFQRLHPSEMYEGTGLGLAIVKKIISKHNGIITATSKEGEGATFIIVLPLKQPDTAPKAKSAQTNI